MNILIVGGCKTADFLLKSLIEKHQNVTIINSDHEYCKKLSRKYEIPVICGDGSKTYILEEAEIEGMDVVIAITKEDATNLVVCELAKKVYGIKKVFATVSNPKNVEVFKSLGVDVTISSAYIVAGIIERMALVDEISNYIPMEEGNISIVEIIVKPGYKICDKLVKDIKFSDEAIISCIIRGSKSIIAKGNTAILENDKLIVLSSSTAQNLIIHDIVGGI